VRAATYTELVEAGYTFLRRRRCPRCGEDIVFFHIAKAKRAPFVLVASGRRISANGRRPARSNAGRMLYFNVEEIEALIDRMIEAARREGES